MATATKGRKKDKQSKKDAGRGSATASVQDGEVVHGEGESGKGKRGAKGKQKSKSKAGKGKKGRKAKKAFSARTADKYELYQMAVQAPESDLDFINRVYKKRNGRKPLVLCEDFCGTALMCSMWVDQSRDHRAFGFDIDPEPVEWGREHNLEPLGDAASRVDVRMEDVRSVSPEPVDVRVGFNFSWSVLTTRADMLEYFRAARASLAEGGLFMIDMHGGPEAIEELEEERSIDGKFKYVWEQLYYWPGTGEYGCAIGFKFKDGTSMKRAFRYTWRFWGMTEIQDVLRDAGFSTIETYFEGADEDGEGNGVFRKSARGENDPSWIAYIVASA